MNDPLPAPGQAGVPHHLLAAVLIAIVPALVADHAFALWQQDEYRLLAGSFAGAYLACAVVLALRARRRGLPSLFESIVFGAAFLCPVAIAAALVIEPGGTRLPDEFSRRDLVTASLLLIGFTVVLGGMRFSRSIRMAGAVTMLLAIVVTLTGLVAQARGLLPGSDAYEVKQSEIIHKPLDAPFYQLALTRYRNFIPAPATLGGALARIGDHELLATGDGDLYEISEKSPTGDLAIQLLKLRVPLNTGELRAEGRPESEASLFRVMDILVRENAGRLTLLASHHYWQRDRHCFVMRVSQFDGDLESLRQAPANTAWKVLYETTPCLKYELVQRTPYTGFVESGGRLALLDATHLLLSTGDHEFDGLHSTEIVSQDPRSDYGKIVLIDLATGKGVEYSSGHRDPQGLFVTHDGAVWSTEHGPQGGDELNLIVAGRNYGWPRVSLGTDYGRTVWPLSEKQGSHEGYEAPVFSWTPAIGVSNLVRVEADAFPLWKGDLLVGSLRGKAIYRVRIENGRALFSAPIRLGFPVRDLEEDARGRILVWTDRDLMTLEPVASLEEGESHAAICLTCHTLYPDPGEHSIGPNLANIVGRRVASAPVFSYSRGLKQVGGKWSRGRLDAFLKNPARFAPGNAMRFPGVPDAAERKAIIDFLETRKDL